MVSVVIPCYNCESFVSRAIESVLRQNYKDWELILVNNNSKDNTQKVLDDYQKKYPDKIRTFLEMKKGGGAARNKGLAEAKGEWIEFLDADDELLPDKLERQLELLKQNNAHIVSSSFFLVKNIKGKEQKTVINPFSSNIWKGLISSKLGITSANLWSKEKLQIVNGWDENLSSSQEYDLLFRLLKADSKICFDTTPSAFIYSMDDSVSKSTDLARVERILTNLVNLRLSIKDYLVQKGIYDEELSQFLDVFLYNHLITRKILAPEYVSEKIKSLHLNAPWKLRLKQNIKYIIKKQMMNFS